MDTEKPNSVHTLLFSFFPYSEQIQTSIESVSKDAHQRLLKKYEQRLNILDSTLISGRIISIPELKMWLTNTISNIDNIPTSTKIQRFTHLIEKNLKSKFTEQLILFALNKFPSHFAPIFQDKSELFEEFFLSDAKRITKWFSFKFSGKNEHGALALEQYLFFKRDSMWETLKWHGRYASVQCDFTILQT